MNRPGTPIAFDKSQVKKGTFKRSMGKLLRFLRPYRLPIIFSIILAIAGTVLTVLGPDFIREITNVISEAVMGQKEMNVSKVMFLGAILASMYGVSLLFNYIQSIVMSTVTQRASKKLRTNISKKINNMPLNYFDTNSTGDTLSRVTNDVDTISTTLGTSFVSLLSSITLIVGAIIMMFITNWILAFTAIATTIIGFLIISLIMSNSQKYFMNNQKVLGEMNGHVEEIYGGHLVVSAYNGQRKAKATFDNINKQLYLNGWKSQFLSGLMMPIMQFVGNLGYVAVCVVGGALAFSGKIEFGTIVAFLIYVNLFTRPLSEIAQSATKLQMTAAASDRVFTFLEEKEMEEEWQKTTKLENIKGNIEFKNVKFGYNPERLIIKDFSLKVKSGQKIAIVGPTGAGKTTMVNLLMRFYEINEGDILIDGISTKEITRGEVHKAFAMVLQDTWLFEGTIKDNIKYSKKDATDEEIYAACEATGIDHFIRTLPNGYDEVLTEQAAISQGQKQLFTIARAMVENAPMLILDEATSSVDTRTEVLIQQAMDKLSNGRTSFVIAHRLSTIKNADIILVMKDGDIIEQGSHNELMKAKGFYENLYNSQFEA